MEYVFEHQYLLIFGFKLFSIIFHPFEVMGRGSETQLQVGKNFYHLI